MSNGVGADQSCSQKCCLSRFSNNTFVMSCVSAVIASVSRPASYCLKRCVPSGIVVWHSFIMLDQVEIHFAQVSG